MGSRIVENIDEALLALLSQGIIHINDSIETDTADYVEDALTLLRASGSPPVKIVINSVGGCMHSSFFIHDMLRSYEGGTTGIVIGKAMSGANLILQGCQERIATFGSLLFVHEMMMMDKLNVLKNKIKFQEYLNDLIAWQNKIYKIYQNRTGKTRRELVAIFEKEKRLSAEQALKLKFIDRVVDAAELIAQPIPGLPNQQNLEFELNSEQLARILVPKRRKKK